MRRHFIFPCAGNDLAASLDTAPGSTGLLIVSGGNEQRCGPWGSQARIAAQIAAAGFPVLRFDRRGCGDSEGENRGFHESADDIAAALAAFREHMPQVERIIGFGNCDGASALMLTAGAGCAGLVLANPWTFDAEEQPQDEQTGQADLQPAMPPALLRAHYARRLTDPAALIRLFSGKVGFGQLFASLRKAAAPAAPRSSLFETISAGLAGFNGPAFLLVAGRDRTGQTFLTQWNKADPRLRHCPSASHSFVEPEAREWLLEQILEMLRNLD